MRQRIGRVVLTIAGLLLVTACGNSSGLLQEEKDVTQIRLVCTSQRLDRLDAACENRLYAKPEDIRVFQDAIEHVQKMDGELDYAAEYEMSVVYEDRSIEAFHLAVGTDRNMSGLLVRRENTGTGYEIPKKDANAIRDLLASPEE